MSRPGLTPRSRKGGDKPLDARSDGPLFPMRTVVVGAFLPTLFIEIGIGAILPLIAPGAVSLGASLQVAALVAALLPVGQMLADVPAGALAARVGDRAAMIMAGGVAMLGFLGAALAHDLFMLGGAVLVIGAAAAVFNLARVSYLTEITPPLRRARIMATLAGVHRIGQFIGPFAGALVVAGSGPSRGFLLGAGTAILGALVLVLVPETSRAARRARADAEPSGASRRPPREQEPTLRAVVAGHRAQFASVGIAVLLVGTVRGARQTVLPLWGEFLELDSATISLIFGLAGAVDMLLFYPAGKVMDRMGRLWIGVPAMLVLGASMLLLPLAHSVGTLTLVAALMGLGNGISTGLTTTLGADLAPKEGRAKFLGVWWVLQDGGMALGPLIVSAGAALGSLAAGIWATGALGAAAAGSLGRSVPRWSAHANRRTRRAAGHDD